MTKHTKIDLSQLAKEIRAMNFRMDLYKVLKRELTALGHWKVKERGDPAKGYKVMKERQNER